VISVGGDILIYLGDFAKEEGKGKEKKREKKERVKLALRPL